MKHFDRFFPPQIDRKLRQTRRLQKSVSAHLPAEFLPHVKTGNLEEGVLTLVVSSQAIASNLRFLGAELQRQIRDELGIDVRQIRIRVSPEQVGRNESGTSPPATRQRQPQTDRERRDRERLRRVLKRL